MRCDEARLAMEAFLDRELEAAAEAALRGHLASCASCARELEERRAFSASLRGAFARALEGVESTGEERERVVERMCGVARRRALRPARLAAALVAGLAVGLAAAAVGLSGRRPLGPEQREVVDLVSEAELRSRQAELLFREAEEDLQKVHEVASRRSENPAVQLASLQLSHIEQLLAPAAAPARSLAELVAATAGPDPAVRGAAKKALRQLPPAKAEELKRAAAAAPACDRVFVGQVIAELEDRSRPTASLAIVVAPGEGGETVEFRQHGDGRVELKAPGLRAEARSVRDLLSRHPDLCRRFGVAGREGAVAVGGHAAAVDLGGQVQLMFRTGDWYEGLQWEAYRAWLAGRVADAARIEGRVADLRERCLRAAQPPPLPEVRIDVQALAGEVQKMAPERLRQARQEAERRARELQERLRELQELRARARSLRVFAEAAAE